MWRDLLRRLIARLERVGPEQPTPAGPDLWGSVGRLPRPESELLARIERTALGVYAAHGLPTAQGHYRRGRRERGWTFLGEHLTPEARWAFVQERPPEDGWRYGTLADIGRSGDPEARAAAGLLGDCARLRSAMTGGVGVDMMETIEAAICLGADWRSLESGRLRVGNTRLRLTAPDDATDTVPPAKPSRRQAARAAKPRPGA